MRIAVDAMGGDHAPFEVVRGALLAARDFAVPVSLVGDGERLRQLIAECPADERPKDEALIEVVHAAEVIAMDEHPATAVRRKKDSSLVVAARLVRDGHCGAMVSAGNTGAAMAASLFTYGRLKGVDRPAIATPMPTVVGFCLIIDAGANAEVKPRNLLEFGVLGSVYAEAVLGRPAPRVGLLNIGEEPSKGTEIAVAAHELLVRSGLNFVGNIEGRDVSSGSADIVVCDGFVGNVVLKFAEGLSSALFDLIRKEVNRGLLTKLGALLARPAFRRVKNLVDYAEYGGAPLLGLQGVTIISHGSSKRKAIRNAVAAGARASDAGLVMRIAARLESMEEGKQLD